MIQLSPLDLKEFNGTPAERRSVFAILTTQTCGEACWHAKEDVCRCSCGGRNHGCLNHGGAKPERTAKIAGHMYRLIAVGHSRDLYAQASEINRRQWRSVESPFVTIDSVGQPKSITPEAIQLAAEQGKQVCWHQYRYTWSETDAGAPARIKSASAAQRNWEELSGWKAERNVSLLWERVTMPEAPTELVIDRETGKPLENQKPTR